MAKERTEKHDRVKIESRATLKTFQPRFQVNANKLEIVFTIEWDHLPAGIMDRLGTAARKFGTLTWEELEVQPEPEEDGDQLTLDSEIGG